LGHSSHPTSIPNFTKFDDEDDMYSINEQVPVSGSTGSTASSPVREEVVVDCINQIYYQMFLDKETLFDDAKRTKYQIPKDVIPTEEEWSLAQEKFITTSQKGAASLIFQ
jgi:hypothetical protein